MFGFAIKIIVYKIIQDIEGLDFIRTIEQDLIILN